ncbi:MAG: DUF2206 domain-containing protein, partial [Deltaproteobacteria bacterium]|nr:DUF2206 domain-containing protein [Deltaproteobacteria bacterium]
YPRQLTLNTGGEQAYLFVHDQDSHSAKWLGEYGEENKKIYADFHGVRRLVSQGKIMPHQTNYRWLFKNSHLIDGYIYLRYQNTMDSKLLGYHNEMYNMEDYKDILNKKDKIYDNKCSKVFISIHLSLFTITPTTRLLKP